MQILVTGCTGRLGTALLQHLQESDYRVKITSRRKPEYDGTFAWVYSDLLTGEGVDEAVQDVEIVIHAATSPNQYTKEIEINGFRNLLKKLNKVKHFIYPSIVGIDYIPMKYFQYKLEAEQLLENSSIPYTIVRATQFHDYVEAMFLSKTYFNRYFIPGKIPFQSCAVEDYARHLIAFLDKDPQGRADDFAGPEIMTLKEMAELKIKVYRENNKIVSFALPGNLYKTFREGRGTNPERKLGKITFEQYLRKKKE